MSIDYSSINSLNEFVIIGGNDITLKFNVVDENGSPVDLTSATCVLKISPYGKPTAMITSLNGSVTSPTDIVEYILPGTTTELMVGGKYQYQPIITDSEGKNYHPKQGTFLLIQSIGLLSDVVDVPSSAYYLEVTGTNNYISDSTAITTYNKGLSIILSVENANTTASDLTIGTAGTKDLKKVDETGTIISLIANDLLPNAKYLFVFDGIQWIMIGGGGGGTPFDIHGLTSKLTIADNDEFPLADSADSYSSKKVLFSLIKSTLTTVFNTLYAPIAKGVTNGDLHDHNGGDGNPITEGAISLSNVTTNNVSITAHGFAPILPNDATKYLDGTGNYTVPALGSQIHTANNKTTPVDADEFAIWDSVTNLLGKVSWSNIKSTLASVFAPYVAPGTIRKLLVSDGTAWRSAALTAAQLADAVAPSTSGNVLTSNGSTWTSAAAAGGAADYDQLHAEIA